MKKQNTYLVIGAVIILAVAGIYGYSTLDIMSGTGTENDPYQVRNWIDLDNIRAEPSAHYILMNNIGPTTDGYDTYGGPLSDEGKGWLPISSFSGSFDGNGHKIDGLYINRPELLGVGLFSLTNGAVFENIGLTNVNIVGNRSVGALVGQAKAAATTDGASGTIIKQCFSTGTVTSMHKMDWYSDSRTGGLVGFLFDGGRISDSWSSVTIVNDNSKWIGGFVGQTGGDLSDTIVTNSFSYGLVDTIIEENNGGFIGRRPINSQAIGCFWDIDTSGKDETQGGRYHSGNGATTVELKTISTFQNAGWDISTGTDTIWTIKSNSYPTLSIFETTQDDPQPTPGFGILVLIVSFLAMIYIVKSKKNL